MRTAHETSVPVAGESQSSASGWRPRRRPTLFSRRGSSLPTEVKR